MIIKLRNSEGKLAAKDILSIHFDMSIEKENNSDFYILRVNPEYVYDEKFYTEEDAEEELSRIAEWRNSLESELRSFQ